MTSFILRLRHLKRACHLFWGAFYKTAECKHHLRGISRLRIRLRHQMANKHILIREVLIKEDGKWKRVKSVTFEKIPISGYVPIVSEAYVEELRAKYYKEYKHSLFENV